MAASVIRSATVTDRGGRRANDDAFVADDAARLWLVADGVGSTADGGDAARRTAARFATFAAETSWNATLADLRDRIAAAHRALTDAAGTGSATTLCLLHIAGPMLAAMWVGDSRLYRWRAGVLDQLTEDHSLVRQLVSRGAVEPADADHHPMANVLTRALGSGALAIGEVGDTVAQDDRYLLCTDGLYRAVDDHHIAAALHRPGPEASVAELMTRATAADDNVTAIAIHVVALGDG